MDNKKRQSILWQALALAADQSYPLYHLRLALLNSLSGAKVDSVLLSEWAFPVGIPFGNDQLSVVEAIASALSQYDESRPKEFECVVAWVSASIYNRMPVGFNPGAQVISDIDTLAKKYELEHGVCCAAKRTLLTNSLNLFG